MITMPAKLYDTLKAVADEFGGVGHTRLYDTAPAPEGPGNTEWWRYFDYVAPRCIAGIAAWVDRSTTRKRKDKLLQEQLLALGIDPEFNDSVFSQAERKDPDRRLAWDTWTKRIGVRRGV